jgi:hypothetical protein
MKIIAFYLPQFHAIPENDKWWGKGFTEWTNTKKAKPLFIKHYQPREPLNDDYYDLSDINTIKNQTKIARKYGVGGFCFYHYWFSGKKLLEKPIENLLKHKEIRFPFCLSWANEPWTRTWDGDRGAKKILINQSYGNESDWENHFNYLLQFFSDPRYLCIDNKPIFLIYRAEHIPNCSRMLRFWDKLAKENGLEGIYFIKTLTSENTDYKKYRFDAAVEFEPFRTLSYYKKKAGRKCLTGIKKTISKIPLLWSFSLPFVNYNEFYRLMEQRQRNANEKVYLGAFVDWDNTARRERNPLLIFKGVSPKNFKRNLKKQINRSIELENEFIFINAWNEWAEGTYLEPDKRYGFAYLNAVKQSLEEYDLYY